MDCLSEGFDMDTGRNLGPDQSGATKILQNLGPKKKGDFVQLYAHNPKLEGTQKLQTTDPNNYLNIDYEIHLGQKSTIHSFTARDYSKRRKNSYCKINMNRNVLKF